MKPGIEKGMERVRGKNDYFPNGSWYDILTLHKERFMKGEY